MSMHRFLKLFKSIPALVVGPHERYPRASQGCYNATAPPRACAASAG